MGLMLGPIEFNVFVNDLGVGSECSLIKFIDKSKLRGVADRPDWCAAIQRYLDRLENQADRNHVKFKDGKWKALHLGRNKPVHQHMLLIN